MARQIPVVAVYTMSHNQASSQFRYSADFLLSENSSPNIIRYSEDVNCPSATFKPIFPRIPLFPKYSANPDCEINPANIFLLRPLTIIELICAIVSYKVCQGIQVSLK